MEQSHKSNVLINNQHIFLHLLTKSLRFIEQAFLKFIYPGINFVRN
jgi:hypothetical protein